MQAQRIIQFGMEYSHGKRMRTRYLMITDQILYMVKSGNNLSALELDKREKALVSAIPFELVAKVLNDADDTVDWDQDNYDDADAVSAHTVCVGLPAGVACLPFIPL
jgi:hypothetical protein